MPSQPGKPTHFLLIAAFALIGMLPAFYSGIPAGPDQSQHYQSMAAVYSSITSGHIYPGVTGGIDHDLGDYRLRFYPPLTYYVLAIARVIIPDWYFVSLIVYTAIFLVGGIGIYLWTKEIFDPGQALIAAAIYTFSPYHLNQLYNSFLLAEFFVMATLPFCFLFLTRICARGRPIDIIGLAVSYSLLILTHLPMTIIGSAVMVIYALLILKKKTAFATAARLLAAVLSAVALTAFYWSRWVPELGWIRHSSPTYFSNELGYQGNFLMIPDHLINFQTDDRSLWFLELLLFTTLLITVPSVIALVRERPLRSKAALAIFSVIAIAVFMTSPLSTFIWDNVAFIQRVQFPWRWLGIISVFGAVFSSLGVSAAANALKNRDNVFLTIGLGSILVVFVFTAAFITKGSAYSPRFETNQQLESVARTEGCECWRPIWAKPSAFNQTEQVVADGRHVDVNTWSASNKQFHIQAGTAAATTIAAFYYPLWAATINGVDTPIDKNEDGLISIAIPPEASDVDLTFREPAYVTAAGVISFALWLFLLVFGALLLIRSKKGTDRMVS